MLVRKAATSSGTVFWTNYPTYASGVAIQPLQVVSRMSQGGTPYDFNLPLSGTPGVECRRGGATGKDFTIAAAVLSGRTGTTMAAGRMRLPKSSSATPRERCTNLSYRRRVAPALSEIRKPPPARDARKENASGMLYPARVLQSSDLITVCRTSREMPPCPATRRRATPPSSRHPARRRPRCWQRT